MGEGAEDRPEPCSPSGAESFPVKDHRAQRAHPSAFSAATGKLLHSLPPSSTTPAFDGTTGIVTWQPVWDGPMTVSAVNLTTGHVYWSRTMGSTAGISAVLPPSGSAVIENGLVWLDLMTDTGHPAVLTALRETTGATASRTDSPCSAGTATGPIGIAQHRIFADAGCGLAVYRAR